MPRLIKEFCDKCSRLNKEYEEMPEDERINCLAGRKPKGKFSGVMLVGEAPGRAEAGEGVPFVGPAGKFLARRVLHPAKINVSSVYIDNIVRCRPKANRTPTDKEIETCRPYLCEAIRKVKPRTIVALGAVAWKGLTGLSNITKWQGHAAWSREFGCWIMPVLHPAALLRSRSEFEIDITIHAAERAVLLAMVSAPEQDPPQVTLVQNAKHIASILGYAKNVGTAVIDVETHGLDYSSKLLGIAVAFTPSRGWFIPTALVKKHKKELREAFAGLKQVIMHNSSFDLQVLQRRKFFFKGKVWDTMLMHHLLDENFRHGLKELAWRYTYLGGYDQPLLKQIKEIGREFSGYGDLPLGVLAEYSGYDAAVTFRIWEKFKEGLDKQPHLRYVYDTIVEPARMVLNEMETSGAPVAEKKLKTLRTKLEDDLNYVENGLKRYAAKRGLEDFNVRSPKQVQELLFRKLRIKPTRETKTGFSTGRGALEDLAGKHLAVDLLLLYRKLLKYQSVYVEGILKRVVDGRVHTHYLSHGTVTGRLCVAGDTLLETSRGTFRISEFDVTKFPNVLIMTHKGRARRVLRRFYKGREEMFSVTLTDGRSIRCTQGHRFLTPNGWRSLCELEEEDQVCTYVHSHSYDTSSLPDGFGREELCAHTTRRLDQGHRSKEVRHQSAALVQDQRSVSGEVRGRTSSSQTSTLLCCYEGQHPRSKRLSSNGHSQSDTEETARCGRDLIQYGREAEDDRMVHSTESSLSRFGANKGVALQDAPARLGLLGEARGVFPRNYAKRSKLLRRSSYFLSQAVRSLLSFIGTGMVRKGTGRGLSRLPRKEEGSAGSHLLVTPPRRVGSVVRAARAPNSSHKAVFVLQEVSGRFCFPWDEAACGGRRSFSLERLASAKEGQDESLSSQAFRLSGTPFYESGSAQEAALGGIAHQVGTIKAIRSVGVQDVWDIEVESDHSYVAQGFINHNSSANPNLQNIPRDRDVRSLFAAPRGRKLVEADYGQAELRIAAMYARDKAMLQLFESGEDIHKATASKMFEIKIKDVTEAQRFAAKAVNFGINYGRGPVSLAKQLGCSLDDAREFISAHFQAFPNLKAFIERTHKTARRKKKVISAFGRVRRLPNVDHDDEEVSAEAERQSVNSLVQGAASDCTMIALTRIAKRLKEEAPTAFPVLTVHDCIVAEADTKDAKKVARLMKEEMERPIEKITVPMEADVEIVNGWGEHGDSLGVAYADVKKEVQAILKRYKGRK